MAYQVATRTAVAAPTAVVRAATTWPEFRAGWKGMLDQVWAWLNAHGVTSGCPNIMLYLDDRPTVEVGVLLADAPEPTAPPAPVVRSQLPAGTVAWTVHKGGCAELGRAHEAVIAWCDEQGRRRAGPRWEVYGPHGPEPEVEICYLLSAT